MKAVVQRVSEASVSVDGELVSKIGNGLLVLLGIAQGDDSANVERIVRKISQMRIFEDADGRMNLSVEDLGGEIIVVSQFTLFADCSRGNRPGFTEAAAPEKAEALYNEALGAFRSRLGHDRVGAGRFRTHMDVRLTNSGPVTIQLEC